jgi:gluconate 2-dehydrogenase gamma chain
MRDIPGLPSRRGFLKASAATAAIAGIAVPAKAEQKPEPVALTEYQPDCLKPSEWAFVMAAVARLIPSDVEGPGAIETRVPVFIDKQLAGDYGKASDWYMVGPYQPAASPLRGWQTPLAPLEIYQQAIPQFDDWCKTTHGKIFAELDAETQDKALTSLQKDEMKIKPELREFFGRQGSDFAPEGRDEDQAGTARILFDPACQHQGRLFLRPDVWRQPWHGGLEIYRLPGCPRLLQGVGRQA